MAARYLWACSYEPGRRVFIWEISSRLTETKKTARRLHKLNYGARELISIVPLVVALSIRVTLLLQLNYGIHLKREIQQVSQNTATEAASDRHAHLRAKYFHPGQPAGVFIWARSTQIPVAETEISVDRAGPVLIWTHRNFYKGNSGRARSRSTGPARSTGLKWTGPHS